MTSKPQEEIPKGNGMPEKEAELTNLLQAKDRQIEKLVNVLNMIQNGINTLR